MKFENFVGIDISKDKLDLAIVTKQGELFTFQFLNERSDIEKHVVKLLAKHNATISDTLFCAEHTGHFSKKLIDVSLKLGLNLWMESAYKILHSQGLIRGKNDEIDAERIAQYAKRFHDLANPIIVTCQSTEILKHLNAERDLLVKDRAKYEGQLKQEEGFLEANYFKTKKKKDSKDDDKPN